ncbi:hypothetical protein HOG98_04100 [bacterium]|jgi:hypothetical protein|nr:hypothetical protein [bacterium]
MKKVFLAAVLATLLAGSTFATTVVTRFNGESSSYSAYCEINEQFELVTGFGLSHQQELETNGVVTTKASTNFSGKVGVATEFPLLGKADVTVAVSKMGDNDLEIGDISLTKNALYNLTDDVAVGISCDILTYNVENKFLTFHKTVQPAISATINFK